MIIPYPANSGSSHFEASMGSIIIIIHEGIIIIIHEGAKGAKGAARFKKLQNASKPIAAGER